MFILIIHKNYSCIFYGLRLFSILKFCHILAEPDRQMLFLTIL